MLSSSQLGKNNKDKPTNGLKTESFRQETEPAEEEANKGKPTFGFPSRS